MLTSRIKPEPQRRKDAKGTPRNAKAKEAVGLMFCTLMQPTMRRHFHDFISLADPAFLCAPFAPSRLCGWQD
jgi:hypothetical protein